MRRVLIMLMISTAALGSETDKAAHVGAGFAAQTGCMALARQFTKSKLVGSLSCTAAISALGAVKEVTDPLHGGSTDGMDIVANSVGQGMSLMIVNVGF